MDGGINLHVCFPFAFHRRRPHVAGQGTRFGETLQQQQHLQRRPLVKIEGAGHGAGQNSSFGGGAEGDDCTRGEAKEQG